MLKQAIIVRKDLKLGKGKIAAQVAHASILASDKSKFVKPWKKEGQKKIVLWAKDLFHLLSLFKKAKEKKLAVVLVEDAGLTQIKKGTKTAIAIGPAPEKDIDEITKGLKLV